MYPMALASLLGLLLVLTSIIAHNHGPGILFQRIPSCMGEGTFPFVNCTVAQECTYMEVHLYHCTDGKRFNATSMKCEADVPCGGFECKQAGTRIPHSQFPRFYGYCRYPGHNIIAVDSCPLGSIFNQTTQSCQTPL